MPKFIFLFFNISVLQYIIIQIEIKSYIMILKIQHFYFIFLVYLKISLKKNIKHRTI